MSCLQKLVHNLLNLQIARHGTGINGLTNKDMIHQAWVDAAVDGVWQETTLEQQCEQLRIIHNLRHTQTQITCRIIA